MKRVTSTVGIVLLCLVAGLIGSVVTRNFGTSDYTISYADFISILLTAISLIMALLAFFIAILAYIGWNSISGKVASEVSKFLEKGFGDGQPLHKMLMDQTTSARYQGVYAVDPEFVEEETEVDAPSGVKDSGGGL